MLVCHAHLEIGRHEGVVHNHYYVFVVAVDNISTSLYVSDLHHGVAGCFNPHQLNKQKEKCNVTVRTCSG